MSETALSACADIRDKALVRSFSYINGKWQAAKSGDSIEVNNPADGTYLGDVTAMSAEESSAAVDAAQAAFPSWAALLPQERAAILRRWFELQLEHKEDLARIMVLEQGKPISEARGEIDYGAAFVEFYSEEAKRPNIEGVTSHLPDAEVELWREPVGVAGIDHAMELPFGHADPQGGSSVGGRLYRRSASVRRNALQRAGSG